MMYQQTFVFCVLLVTLALFIWGRWRYDLVSLLAVLTLTVAGIVPADEAFSGFGHPAVVTVAAVLIISRALMNTGLVDRLAALLSHVPARPTMQVGTMTGLATMSSGFMNNVGALALLLPVTVRMARAAKQQPSVLLMPLAFGSLLGGMTTLIGTPPNIIIASLRAEAMGEPFRMFDFTPVGAGVALAGLLFVTFVGWRLMPKRKGQASREELFQIDEYTAELRVTKESPLAGLTLHELDKKVEGELVVVALLRGKRRLAAPSGYETLREGDVLIVEAESEAIKALDGLEGLELVGNYKFSEEDLGSDEVSVVEAVVMADAPILGRTLGELRFGWRYGVNVLAVARQGAPLRSRPRQVRPRPGDVLLLQVRNETLQEALQAMGCLPLAERGMRLGQPRRVVLAVAVFAAALAAAATGALPVQVALPSAAVAMILLRMVSVREMYESIDWPVIVLLGAMIPVGGALETTGGAQRIAALCLSVSAHMPEAATLGLIMVATMFLSDMINNAAAAVLMAPIAVRIAAGLDASPDPFLMGVAVAASCAFLTPIGHQSNTLVMGPGGYRFGDYWKMGLPLEIVVLAVSLPLLMHVWPLYPMVGQ
jgi:di/tricarboxylate transporter